MNQTPLHSLHIQQGAKMIPFAGFEMPVYYRSIKEEHAAVRNHVAWFDISHMAPIFFIGPDALSFLEENTCRRVAALQEGQVQYNAFIFDHGGVADDITLYKFKNFYMAIVNAANKEKIMTLLQQRKMQQRKMQKKNQEVQIQPAENYVLLAIQGKESPQRLAPLLEKFFSHTLSEIYFYESVVLQPELNQFVFYSRTGYTGEDGFEILLPADLGHAFARALLDSQCMPAGLAARDLLRLEVFYPLYGHELRETWTPYEGGIGWLVDADKNFHGKTALLTKKQHMTHRVRGFRLLESGVPRENYKVFTEDSQEIGFVTSGAFSFLWNIGFGMAFLEIPWAQKNSIIFIDIRGKRKKAEVLLRSPYTGSIVRRHAK